MQVRNRRRMNLISMIRLLRIISRKREQYSTSMMTDRRGKIDYRLKSNSSQENMGRKMSRMDLPGKMVRAVVPKDS